MRRPHVICADVTSWEAFVALGAALTRRGTPVLRLTGPGGTRAQRLRVQLERVAFSETRPELKDDGVGGIAIAPLVGALTGAMDVQCTDRIGFALVRTPEWAARADLHRVRAVGLDDRVLYDKLAYTRLAEKHDVPVPETWDSLETIPAGADLIVKRRLGSGGDGVMRLGRGVALHEAWTRLGADGVAMAQQALHGELWSVGGVARDGEIIECSAFRSVSNPTGAGGPSHFIVPLDRADLVDSTATLLSALGLRGPFCLDFITDASGTPRLIDLNARFFGSWPALQASGVDVLGAYLNLMGLQPRPSARVRVTGRAFPTAPSSATGHPLSALSTTTKLVREVGRELGPRWKALAVVEALSHRLSP